MPIADIYCRRSEESEGTQYSLEYQEEQGRNFAADKGYQVDTVYREVFTGKRLYERPELTKLRERVRNKEIDAVIVLDVYRLSRSQNHAAILYNELQEEGIKLLFVLETFENDSLGRFTFGLKSYLAEAEAEKILERTVRGRHNRAKTKLIPGRKALYGYQYRDKDKASYEIKKEESEVVERIYRDANEGTPLSIIAETLSNEHIPTPNGNERWHRSSVHKILKNPFYYGKAHSWIGDTEREANPPERALELPEGTVPAISP